MEDIKSVLKKASKANALKKGTVKKKKQDDDDDKDTKKNNYFWKQRTGK